LGLLSGDASPCIYVKHVTEQKKIRTVYDCTYSKDMVLVLEKQSADGISLVDQVSITIS